jgi:hypothetical protein
LALWAFKSVDARDQPELYFDSIRHGLGLAGNVVGQGGKYLPLVDVAESELKEGETWLAKYSTVWDNTRKDV